MVDDSNTFISSDHHFHLCIAKAAKNSVLGDFIEKIRDLLRSNISLVIQKSDISRRSLDYHQRIYEAIKEGNAAQARKVMAAHIADIEKEFFKILYRPLHPLKEGNVLNIPKQMMAAVLLP
jgi:GntR family transcriptional repressor for pyruvate dehydrogenase complex